MRASASDVSCPGSGILGPNRSEDTTGLRDRERHHEGFLAKPRKESCSAHNPGSEMWPSLQKLLLVCSWDPVETDPTQYQMTGRLMLVIRSRLLPGSTESRSQAGRVPCMVEMVYSGRGPLRIQRHK